MSIHVPPGLQTSWRRSVDKPRIWYLTVLYEFGDRKVGAEYFFEPYPGMPPIEWVNFENEKVQEFMKDLATRKVP